MTAFDSYAQYYDLVYNDKDYVIEACFVAQILGRHGVPRGHLLDLGCGTGRHALAMAGLGFRVDGVDLSEKMLECAEMRRANETDPEIAARLSFRLGDACSYAAGRRYEAVLALFHVLSYQTTDHGVQATLATARRHLAPGAPFVFDIWHGPAVLNDPPSRREKSVENEQWHLHRISDPVWLPDQDRVQVLYKIRAKLKKTNVTTTASERHDVRYMFLPWLKEQLSLAGFRAVEEGEWLTRRAADEKAFSVYIVARAE